MALQRAAIADYLRVTLTLLEVGADINVSAAREEGRTP